MLFIITSCTKDDVLDRYTTDMYGVLVEYWHNDNGSWSTTDHTYNYRIVLNGNIRWDDTGTEFVILCNTQNVTFEQCFFKVFNISSDMIDTKEFVVVEMRSSLLLNSDNTLIKQ